MDYHISVTSSARHFSVPCKAIDEHLKEASGDFFKVLLYILGSESSELSTDDIASKTGVLGDTVDNAILYWNKAGIVSLGKPEGSAPAIVSSNELNPDANSIVKEAPVKYDSKQIAKIVDSDIEIKTMLDELAVTLHRNLRFSEICGYINLYEYYGFSAQSIIILAEHCVGIGKSSIKYIEAVAKSMFENGLTDYHDVEQQIQKMSEAHSYEGKLKAMFGINSNLSTRQSQMIESWRQKEFSEELIKAAYELTLDNTGKLSFAYMNKILLNWEKEGVKTTNDIEASNAKKAASKKKPKDKSYDIGDFENYSINFLTDNKE
ncbi:MAG: DnaD domain protein [Ruminococcus sp.]|nr:DnaD domain protein [Ruminococcus sp.]